MSSTERKADAGARRGRSIVLALSEELHTARLDRGLSQLVVASAAGLSQSRVSRVERGLVPAVSVVELARLLAIVGLELTAKAYPAGPPVRDAAHRALLDRLRLVTSPAVAWRFEVPLPIAGDQRAWDATLAIGQARIGIEAETHLRDVQAVQRRIGLKRRDDARMSQVILLVADTRTNRATIRDHGEALAADLPVAGKRILADLREGRDPPGSGLVML